MNIVDLEADLRFDGPAGAGRITADTGGIVIRVSGWGRLLRLAFRLWRRPPEGRSALRLARALARASGLRVYLDAGLGPRLRLATPPGG